MDTLLLWCFRITVVCLFVIALGILISLAPGLANMLVVIVLFVIIGGMWAWWDEAHMDDPFNKDK